MKNILRLLVSFLSILLCYEVIYCINHIFGKTINDISTGYICASSFWIFYFRFKK